MPNLSVDAVLGDSLSHRFPNGARTFTNSTTHVARMHKRIVLPMYSAASPNHLDIFREEATRSVTAPTVGLGCNGPRDCAMAATHTTRGVCDIGTVVVRHNAAGTTAVPTIHRIGFGRGILNTTG